MSLPKTARAAVVADLWQADRDPRAPGAARERARAGRAAGARRRGLDLRLGRSPVGRDDPGAGAGVAADRAGPRDDGHGRRLRSGARARTRSVSRSPRATACCGRTCTAASATSAACSTRRRCAAGRSSTCARTASASPTSWAASRSTATSSRPPGACGFRRACPTAWPRRRAARSGPSSTPSTASAASSRISASSSRAPARSACSRPPWRTTPGCASSSSSAPRSAGWRSRGAGARRAVVSIEELPTAEARLARVSELTDGRGRRRGLRAVRRAVRLRRGPRLPPTRRPLRRRRPARRAADARAGRPLRAQAGHDPRRAVGRHRPVLEGARVRSPHG